MSLVKKTQKLVHLISEYLHRWHEKSDFHSMFIRILSVKLTFRHFRDLFYSTSGNWKMEKFRKL